MTVVNIVEPQNGCRAWKILVGGLKGLFHMFTG